MDDITVVISRVTDETGVSRTFRSKRLHRPSAVETGVKEGSSEEKKRRSISAAASN
jgi:hypothetical protein